jgi:hypothetical protein
MKTRKNGAQGEGQNVRKEFHDKTCGTYRGNARKNESRVDTYGSNGRVGE